MKKTTKNYKRKLYSIILCMVTRILLMRKVVKIISVLKRTGLSRIKECELMVLFLDNWYVVYILLTISHYLSINSFLFISIYLSIYLREKVIWKNKNVCKETHTPELWRCSHFWEQYLFRPYPFYVYNNSQMVITEVCSDLGGTENNYKDSVQESTRRIFFRAKISFTDSV